MRYYVQYQEMGSYGRPLDHALNEEELETGDGKATPIPNVDDHIYITDKLYRVTSKLFSYYKDDCYINIVLTEIPLDEEGKELFGKLLKE